jgi:hypothetical protein
LRSFGMYIEIETVHGELGVIYLYTREGHELLSLVKDDFDWVREWDEAKPIFRSMLFYDASALRHESLERLGVPLSSHASGPDARDNSLGLHSRRLHAPRR